MNARIEVLLSIWGKWAIKAASKALGYPTSSAGFADYQPPKGDVYEQGRAPGGVAELDILRIDGAINRLPTFLKIVVIEVYQTRQSQRAIAARLGCSPQTLGRYLTEAHTQISVDLQNQLEHNHAIPASFGNCTPNKPAKA